MDRLSEVTGLLLRFLYEGPKTVRAMKEIVAVSKATIYSIMKKQLADEVVDFTVHGTSSGGRPPKYWSLTEKGKLLVK